MTSTTPTPSTCALQPPPSLPAAVSSTPSPRPAPPLCRSPWGKCEGSRIPCSTDIWPVYRLGIPFEEKINAAILCLLVPTCAFASDNSYKVVYDGGSLPSIKAGTGVKLYIDPGQIRIERDKADLVKIPASSVTEVSYGQDVQRRVDAAIGLAVLTHVVFLEDVYENRNTTT